MGFPIQEIERATGLALYGEPGPFMSKAGTLLGFKRNFLFAIGARGEDNRVCTLVRFKAVEDASALLNALKADAAIKKMYKIADIKTSGEQSVVWTFSQPLRFKVDEFAAALDSMANVVSQFAKAFEMNKCEGCGAAISDLTLANGIPNLMCDACQNVIVAQQAQAKQEYERRKPNAGKALLFGVGMAVVAGLLSTYVRYWDISGDNRYHLKLFFLMPIGLSAAIAWAVRTGVRRVTVGACILATIVALIAGALSDAQFFALYYAQLEGWQWSPALLVNCVLSLPFLEWEFNWALALMTGLSLLGSGFICWSLKPKFSVTFKKIGMPPQAASGTGLAMSASV
jgi:hypothetical protein